jgi:hypothetical protein
MGSLLSAVATGTEMRSSLEDNVDTIKLVDALYTSVETNSVVKP